MISKLPSWVWIGASILACIAGVINAVGFLGFQQQGITHLTGTSTMLGIAIARTEMQQMIHLTAVILFFVAGAFLSGFMIRDSTLQLGRRYGMALLIESVLLLAAVPLLQQQRLLGDYMASAAMGLQNAMVSTYSGAVVRTTHVSGVFTDIGIFLGHLMRGLPVDWRKFRLWVVLAASFAGGGVIGAILFAHFSYTTLYIPAVMTGVVGMAYGIYQHWKRYGRLFFFGPF